MKPKRFLALAASLGCAAACLAADPPPTENPAGQELAAKLRAETPLENTETRGTLKIDSPSGTYEVPVVCKVKMLGKTWEATYETSATSRAPAERLTVIHSAEGPNQYLYAQAPSPSAPLPEPSPVSGDALFKPLAGSDFSLSDLGLNFFHWPQQLELHGEMRLGQPCYVLQSSNPGGKPITRIVSFIDEESNGLLLADAYDKDGHIVKEFSLHGSSFKKVNGHWRLEKMEIRDKTKHSHTTLKFDIPDSP
jgi:hypothetical protein